MKYVFATQLAKNYNGYYTNFHNSIQKHTTGEYCDIRTYINENQNEWLNSLEVWHSKLCQIGSKLTPYWWLIDGSRFYTWSPPIYSPFIFSLAVKKYCDELNIHLLTMIDCPKEVCTYLKEIDSSAEFIVQNNFKAVILNSVSYWNRIINNIWLWILALLTSLRYSLMNNHNSNGERLLVFSQIFDNIEEKNNTDHYFGNIFKHYEAEHNNQLLWIYQYNINLRSDACLKKKALLKNKNFKIVDKLNSPVDIMKLLLVYFYLIIAYHKIKKKLPTITIDGIHSKILPREYFSFMVNGIFPVQELLTHNAFKKLIKNNHNIDTIIYPYEEKSIERAILLSIEDNSKITSIGYSHSVHWNLHYYFHVRPFINSNPPRPDLYAVTGKLEKWWLNNIANVPNSKIKVLGSNRYVDKKFPLPTCFYNVNKMKVLMVVGQSCDLSILANYLDEEVNIFSQCDLLIRKYPFSWDDEQEIGISRIKNYVVDVKVNNDEMLQNQIQWCDIMIYNTSSCGIIAMLSGRIAINVALHDIFYWNPFEKESSNNAVIHCSSAFELNQTINQLQDIDAIKYKEIQNKQYSYAKSVYSLINNRVLNELLS